MGRIIPFKVITAFLRKDESYFKRVVVTKIKHGGDVEEIAKK